jgi:hypothetical protein
MGLDLLGRLERHQQVKVHAIVKAATSAISSLLYLSCRVIA